MVHKKILPDLRNIYCAFVVQI